MNSENKFSHFVKFLKKEFFKKKILILGFGKEGRSSYNLLKKYLPDTELAIADKNQSLQNHPLLKDELSEKPFFGEEYLSAIAYSHVILKSPGIKIPEGLVSTSQQLTSQTDLFMRFYKNQVIGVTGTKGKSTTASLINHIIKRVGKKSILLGNIGTPCFDMTHKIENDNVVYELSAHQLEFVTVSPHIAVLLNIFPEHLDYFSSFNEYKIAKENIFRFQTSGDILIAHESLMNETLTGNSTCYYFGQNSKDDEKDLKIPLLGKHNYQNAQAAVFVAEQLGISRKNAISPLSDFQTLPHRLEYLGRFREIDFYNDSISTIPESAIAAVQALNHVDTIILGGFDRGLDYTQLISFFANSKVSNFIFLGKAGERMRLQLEEINKNNLQLFTIKTLEDALPVIIKFTKKGHICLLSPAASSYDQFHNFEHRGDLFKKMVFSLKADK